jgi:hypothetical protein
VERRFWQPLDVKVTSELPVNRRMRRQPAQRNTYYPRAPDGKYGAAMSTVGRAVKAHGRRKT